MTEQSVLKAIVGALTKQIPAAHFRVILFGSRAGGRAREGSDYDIAIDAQEKIPFSALAKVEADIGELPTLAKVDLVDLRTAGQVIAQAASTEGKVIYEQ